MQNVWRWLHSPIPGSLPRSTIHSSMQVTGWTHSAGQGQTALESGLPPHQPVAIERRFDLSLLLAYWWGGVHWLPGKILISAAWGWPSWQQRYQEWLSWFGVGVPPDNLGISSHGLYRDRVKVLCPWVSGSPRVWMCLRPSLTTSCGRLFFYQCHQSRQIRQTGLDRTAYHWHPLS